MKALLVAAMCAVSVSVAGAVTVEHWAPRGIASARFESHGAFDPMTGDFWFVRSAKDLSGWRMYVSACGPHGWQEAEAAPVSGDGVEADPWFSADGRTLWFISSRSTDGVKRKDTDIWRVSRDATGHWGTPERLPAPVNSDTYEWFPRVAADGWLYFGSGRAGGIGKTDIWRAKEDASGVWQVENLGAPVNTPANEYEPLIAPDGSWMIVDGDDGFYRSERDGNGWRGRTKLDPPINTNGSEIAALFSPSGRTMLFARDTKGPQSGEFFVAHLGAKENWPPRCPR